MSKTTTGRQMLEALEKRVAELEKKIALVETLDEDGGYFMERIQELQDKMDVVLPDVK